MEKNFPPSLFSSLRLTPSPKPHNNHKNCFPGCGVSLSQTDSTTASVGPIAGPVCALPRWACFPGRPLLALPGQSGGRTGPDRHYPVYNGVVTGFSLLHRICLVSTVLSSQGLVLLYSAFFLLFFSEIVVFASWLMFGLHFCSTELSAFISPADPLTVILKQNRL